MIKKKGRKHKLLIARRKEGISLPTLKKLKEIL
jgi:hypothetical protein